MTNIQAAPKFAPKKLDQLELLMAQIIWGQSGCGKTTLASTAPGAKLWLLFDPGGCDSIRNRDDIHVLDFNGMPDSITEKLKEGDAFGIKQYLTEHPEIQTIVFDSVTTYGEMALRYGIKHAAASPTNAKKPPTAEEPGMSGYGRKNTWVNMAVWNVFRIARENGKHCIFLIHEDAQDKDEKGTITGYTMMLGSSLAEQIPIKFNEVWWLSDSGKERRIAVRPCRLRRPMKSRMFITTEAPEFIWNYNADTQKGEGIADWYKLWREAGKKVRLP